MKHFFLTATTALFVISPSTAQTTIDVMILYDKQAVEWLNSNNRSSLDFAIDTLTRAEIPYRNSNINMQFNLVHQGCIDYTTVAGTDGRNMGADLDFMTGVRERTYPYHYTQQPDPTVTALREQYGADLVQLIVNINHPEFGGWVAGIGSVSYRYDNAGNIQLTADGGFSVASIQDVNESDIARTSAHEIGHNFGAGHALEQGGSRLYDYAYANYFGTSPQYYSVMAYQESASQISAPVFSSATGRYNGLSTGSLGKNNTRVISENLPAVAAFKNTTNQPLSSINCANTEAPTAPVGLFFLDGFEEPK